jgi:hypothetical protein
MPKATTPLTLAVAACCLFAGLSACGSRGGHSSGGHPSGAASIRPASAGDEQVMSALRQFSRCARDHGQPGFSDPILDPRTSRPVLPDDAPHLSDAARRACGPILARLPPQALASHPPSPEYMQGLLRFARCVRDHGLADWPDPDSLGRFRLPPRLTSQGKQGFAGPMRACDQLNPAPGKRIDIVQAR